MVGTPILGWCWVLDCTAGGENVVAGWIVWIAGVSGWC